MEPKYKRIPVYFAVGSAMEVMPLGDYSEYMPQGTAAQRLNSSWARVGETLTKSMESYDEKEAGHSYS